MPSCPSPDEIEISIFGKGFGECIVVHLGDGKWMIVDSFKNPYTKEPVALEYLQSIGVNYQESVVAVLATHWHDDHICGLSKIVNQCKSAMFITSEATKLKEFLELIYSDSSLSESRPGIQEFKKILDELSKNRESITRAAENKMLINDLHFQIHSLSPSDEAITLAQREIISLLPQTMQLRKGIAPIAPNHTGVVLLICAGNQKVLLGADLEEIGNEKLGWRRIIASPGRPTGRSTAFKVPHHGSITAHHEEVWTSLLEGKPRCLLSSFVRGNTVLPKKDDISRILKFTDKAWVTTNPFVKRRSQRRDNTVERTIKESTKSIRSISDNGQIRIRANRSDACSSWKVDLFGSAIPLANI